MDPEMHHADSWYPVDDERNSACQGANLPRAFPPALNCFGSVANPTWNPNLLLYDGGSPASEFPRYGNSLSGYPANLPLTTAAPTTLFRETEDNSAFSPREWPPGANFDAYGDEILSPTYDIQHGLSGPAFLQPRFPRKESTPQKNQAATSTRARTTPRRPRLRTARQSSGQHRASSSPSSPPTPSHPVPKIKFTKAKAPNSTSAAATPPSPSSPNNNNDSDDDSDMDTTALSTIKEEPHQKEAELKGKEKEKPPSSRARKTSHNHVEKQYRNRLNNQFDRLLGVVAAMHQRRVQCGSGTCTGDERVDGMVITDPSAEALGERLNERRVSKGEVLVLATRLIRALGEEHARLKGECGG